MREERGRGGESERAGRNAPHTPSPYDVWEVCVLSLPAPRSLSFPPARFQWPPPPQPPRTSSRAAWGGARGGGGGACAILAGQPLDTAHLRQQASGDPSPRGALAARAPPPLRGGRPRGLGATGAWHGKRARPCPSLITQCCPGVGLCRPCELCMWRRPSRSHLFLSPTPDPRVAPARAVLPSSLPPFSSRFASSVTAAPVPRKKSRMKRRVNFIGPGPWPSHRSSTAADKP